MSKAYLAAFAVIAAAAVGGVDYVNQSKAAGVKPGQLAIRSYVATISGRFLHQKQAMAAAAERQALLAKAPRDLLPEPPDGWSRRDWDEGSEAIFGKRYNLRNDENAPDELKSDPTVQALSALDKAAGDRRDAEEVYVYEKPGAVVALRLSVATGDQIGGIPGIAMKMAADNIEAMSGKSGFAVVEGVTFREEHGLFGAGSEARSYRIFTGRIGETVTISLRAKAEDPDILTLLEAIDYDRLNRLPEFPVAGIGSAAPVIGEGQQQAEAERRVKEDSQKQIDETASNQLKLQEAALELSRKVGNISDADYDRTKATLERQRALVGEPDGNALPQVEAAADPAVSGEPGGAMGFLSAFMGSMGLGGNSTDDAADAPISAPPTGSRPLVKTFGSGNCVSSGLGKRCSVGN